MNYLTSRIIVSILDSSTVGQSKTRQEGGRKARGGKGVFVTSHTSRLTIIGTVVLVCTYKATHTFSRCLLQWSLTPIVHT